MLIIINLLLSILSLTLVVLSHLLLANYTIIPLLIKG